MTTFQRNAIIAGYINSYCLVCECFFETEEQTFSHIEGEEHETRQLLYPYLEKYGNNNIRKVKAGYFCEHCSLLMATAAKVNLHIAEKVHYYTKGNSLLKQCGSVFTAFDDVLISDSAWHSFMEDTCALCDAEFDDAYEHKMERSHILKLLQNKVRFGEDNNIYRKIDKTYFQCLTCNCVPAESSLDQHFNDDRHKQIYIQCQEEKKKYDLANPKEKKVIKATKTKLKEVEENVPDTNIALNNIETVTGKAVAIDEIKQAENTTETKPLPNQQTKITIDLTKTELVKIQADNDPAIFAAHNKLAYDPRNTNSFCKICEKRFPSTLHGMKEHVQGRDHINKLARAASKPAPKNNNKKKLHKRSMEHFVQSVCTFSNILDNDTVINETICVPEKSCHLFTKIKSMFSEYKCQICLMNLSDDDLEDHCRTVKHERGMRQTEMVFGLNNELIREVRPDSFHCAFCNLMIPGWTAVEKHLKSSEHKTSAASCHRRLQIHLPAIKAQKNDEQAKTAFLEFVNHIKFN